MWNCLSWSQPFEFLAVPIGYCLACFSIKAFPLSYSWTCFIFMIFNQNDLFSQSAIRGYFGRMLFKQELHEHRAITIQKMVRSYLARRRYKRVMRGIVLLQSHYRRRRAKKQLKVLKVCHTFVCIYIAGLSYILDVFCILIKLASLVILD